MTTSVMKLSRVGWDNVIFKNELNVVVGGVGSEYSVREISSVWKSERDGRERYWLRRIYRVNWEAKLVGGCKRNRHIRKRHWGFMGGAVIDSALEPHVGLNRVAGALCETITWWV